MVYCRRRRRLKTFRKLFTDRDTVREMSVVDCSSSNKNGNKRSSQNLDLLQISSNCQKKIPVYRSFTIRQKMPYFWNLCPHK